MIEKAELNHVYPDPKNPRESDDARLHLLRLSLQKLGFVHPIYANKDGMILSGHQRHRVATDLNFKHLPVEFCDLKPEQEKGINVLFNRATNDMTAFDTGKSSEEKIEIGDLMAQAEAMEDYPNEDFLAYYAEETDITGLGKSITDQYNRKSMLITATLRRYGIRIPIVMTESGDIVNGVHRLFEARHEGIKSWPVVTIPDAHGALALNLLNYLSMDYAVDGEFATMLRYSAYRRPQNARGILPKGMRFWAAGERTIPDSDAYSKEFWENFRHIHGRSILDFGGGRCKVAGHLNAKGFECLDFEPFRLAMDRPEFGIGQGADNGPGRSTGDVRLGEEGDSSAAGGNIGGSTVLSNDGGMERRGRRRRKAAGVGVESPTGRGRLPRGSGETEGESNGRRRRRRSVGVGDVGGGDISGDIAGGHTGDIVGGGGKPDPVFSRECATRFLDDIEAGRKFDTIFLASVLNSIPFPRDRQCVLSVVHALCSFETITYGTCRDISDFSYEYSGIRNATYFVFDSEPGVRLGDALSNPKIQKFHTQDEFKESAKHFWKRVETWKGGNIFYWRASAPKRVNPTVLRQALEFEFDLPYADGSTMALGERAVEAFSRRLDLEL